MVILTKLILSTGRDRWMIKSVVVVNIKDEVCCPGVLEED
jgi:hypothetical protein